MHLTVVLIGGTVHNYEKKTPSMHHAPDPTLQHITHHVTTSTVADDPQPGTSHVNESPPCQSYRRSSRVRKSVERLISTMLEQQCMCFRDVHHNIS